MPDDLPPPTQRNFPCNQCGANLEFAPDHDALKCPYCGAENTITIAPLAIEELGLWKIFFFVMSLLAVAGVIIAIVAANK